MNSSFNIRRLSRLPALFLFFICSCGDVLRPYDRILLPLDSALELAMFELCYDDYMNTLDAPCLAVYTRKAYPDTGYRHLLWTSQLNEATREMEFDVYAVQWGGPGCCGNAFTSSMAIRPLSDLSPGIYSLELTMHYPDQDPVVDHYFLHYFPYDSLNIYPPCGDSSRVIGSTCP